MRPAEELYLRQSDPDCATNVAQQTPQRELRKQLETRLEKLLTAQGDPRMSGNGKVFDEYKPTKNAGFYDDYLKGKQPKAGWINPGDVEPSQMQP